MKLFKILMVMGVLAFGAGAATAAVAPLPPMVINFGTGIGSGGTISYDLNGVDVTGTDIHIGALNVYNAPDGSVDRGFTVGGLLNFSTADNTIVITGTVVSLGITDSNTVLLTGSFNQGGWSFGPIGVPGLNVFTGSGEDTKSEALLTALGAPADQAFEFFGFSVDSDFAGGGSGGVVSTDITNTAVASRTPEVPIPAAAWLFGSGLLGLMGVARRKV